eukprot:747584-Hanusia_phi.AAC.2
MDGPAVALDSSRMLDRAKVVAYGECEGGGNEGAHLLALSQQVQHPTSAPTHSAAGEDSDADPSISYHPPLLPSFQFNSLFFFLALFLCLSSPRPLLSYQPSFFFFSAIFLAFPELVSTLLPASPSRPLLSSPLLSAAIAFHAGFSHTAREMELSAQERPQLTAVEQARQGEEARLVQVDARQMCGDASCVPVMAGAQGRRVEQHRDHVALRREQGAAQQGCCAAGLGRSDPR